MPELLRITPSAIPALSVSTSGAGEPGICRTLTSQDAETVTSCPLSLPTWPSAFLKEKTVLETTKAQKCRQQTRCTHRLVGSSPETCRAPAAHTPPHGCFSIPSDSQDHPFLPLYSPDPSALFPSAPATLVSFLLSHRSVLLLQDLCSCCSLCLEQTSCR